MQQRDKCKATWRGGGAERRSGRNEVTRSAGNTLLYCQMENLVAPLEVFGVAVNRDSVRPQQPLQRGILGLETYIRHTKHVLDA